MEIRNDTKRLRYVSVDDEQACRNQVKTGIARYCPTLEYAGEAHSVKDALNMIPSLSPDLVFLDIHMSDGTGFDLLNQLKERNFQVIFITGFQQHAIRAFELNALDYLLKPIDQTQFEAINGKIEWFNDVFINQQPGLYHSNEEFVVNQIQRGQVPRQLVIKQSQGLKIIGYKDIVYLEADGSYTRIHKADGEIVVASRGLRSFEKLLHTDSFFRIHKSTLVNRKHLVEFFFGNPEQVVLSNGHRREVSRRRKQSFLDWVEPSHAI